MNLALLLGHVAPYPIAAGTARSIRAEPREPWSRSKVAHRRAQIPAWLQDHPNSTASDIAAAMGCSIYTAHKDLRTLRAQGLTTITGKAQGAPLGAWCLTWSAI